MKPLEGRIALVAGATRGAGRGIAMMLGEAGATVYCTGRSVRGRPATGTRPETIEETAERVDARGGRGIAVRTDHTVEGEVAELCARVKREQGRLDVLINDIWGGDELTEFSLPFWKLAPAKGRLMLERGIYSHILTSRYAVPLMLEHGRGLIVEITDGDTFGYRGNLFYDLVKMSVIRLAFDMAWDLRRHAITALAVTPGFLRSEAMLENFGVTEANWQEGAAKDPHFIASETPFYVGRAVAALAADPNVAAKSGRVFSSWALAKEYGFKDEDGRQPDWGTYFQQAFGRSYAVADEAAYAAWLNGPMEIAAPDWPKE
ncbi:SDR family oxidoreductase [Hyalangium sp.]|uniref:SDR family oxidoreductase n=1 Tax=Hyalangium sp. TaxID=2028555 RepID=UPI002D64808D|nr:SDR family oxidoreductase [Hyalangium sp.]HYI03101.1 SDR family oxidoreductase [Hyalangium sp.]